MQSVTTVTKHEQIKQAVKQLLRERELPPGSKIPSESDLAAQYNVCRMTVSRAISELVAENFLYRVHGRGTFVAQPNEIETFETVTKKDLDRSSDRQKPLSAGVIGVVTPNVDNPLFAEVVHEIAAQTSRRQMDILFEIAHDDANRELEFIQRLKNNGIRNLLRFPNCLPREQEIKNALKAWGLRAVFLNDFWSDNDDVDSVKIDEVYGMKLALNHLTKLGHRRIAFLDYGPEVRKNCLKVYRQFLLDKAVGINQELIILMDSDRELKEKVLSIVSSPYPPTALVTPYDDYAIKVIQIAVREGLSIPEDLSVVGFGDVERAASEDISLTTVHYPKGRLIKYALNLLLQKNPVQETVTKIIKPHLVIRGSTGKTVCYTGK